MTDESAFTPDWASPPGDTIADALDESNLSQADLAQRTGFTRKHINDLIKGRATITADAALRLEAVLGEPAAFWLRREAHYREALARRAARHEAEAQESWLDQLPVRFMLKQRWIRRCARKAEQVEECLRFFGVASVDAWKWTCTEPLAAFRASAGGQAQLGAVASWLRQAELMAGEIECRPFASSVFKVALPELRALTTQPDPRVFIPRMQETCAAAGVAVVFLPAPPGCPLYGATRWLTQHKALLALSLRYKTNDQLWFSFFHEAAHLLKHGRKMVFIEGIDGLSTDLEDEANRFAANLLIPPAVADKLAALRSIDSVRSIAAELGIAPGIVVGRMQKEGFIPWSNMNHLKVRYSWLDPDSGTD